MSIAVLSIIRKFTLFIFLFSLAWQTYAQTTPVKEQYSQATSAYQSGDYALAEKFWQPLAENGDANSQYAMSIMHLKKEVANANDTSAYEYLVAAANQQHLAAIFNLGVAYWEGRGVARQTDKAIQWWEIGAKKQDAGAQYNLGLAYYIGEGRAQSNENALYWLQQAAENNHPQATAFLSKVRASVSSAEKKANTAQSDQIDKIISEIAQQTAALESKLKASEAPDPSPENISKPKAVTTAAVAPVVAPAPVVTPAAPDISVSKASVLRASPDISAVQLATLKQGQALKVINEHGAWSEIVTDIAYPAWVYESFLDNVNNGTAKIKGKNVNIRPSPSTDNRTSAPLARLNTGDKVTILLTQSPWVKIIPPKPFPVWVLSQNIK